MDDMTETSLNALVKFLYYRDIEDATNDNSIALELLRCANKYGIDCLGKAAWEILTFSAVHTFDTKLALKLFAFGYSTDNMEFKQKAVQVLKR